MTPSAATATPTRLRRAQRHADRNTRRWQRWPRLLLTLGCCLLALWPATRGEALSISGFKNDLVEFLLEQVSVPGEFEIRAGRIEQLESGGTVLEEVRIIDSQGVWFTAARFDFSWSPSRLLRGEVQIDHLNLVGGRLNRLPVAKPAPSESTRAADTPARGGWPRSPIALLIKRVSIRDMQVSDSVLPQRLGFDANGALRDDGNEQSLQLDLTRTDTVAGRIDLSYTRRFEPDALQLQIGANEAPAGLVATLLGLPNDVPVDLQLQADGPPSAWGGDLSLAGEGLLGAHGQFEAAWAERIRARFDLDLSPGPRLAAGVRGAIGEQARLRFTALEHDDGRVVVETARIDSAGLQARASGYLDRTARTLDLDLQVESDGQSATRLARLTEPLRFANANLRVRVSGAMDDPRIEARGELGRPLASGFGASRASIDLQARAGADATTLTLDAALHEPFGPTPEVARALGPQLRLSLDGRREADTIRLASLRLDARGLGFSADGSLRLGEVLTPDLNYALRLDTLSPWAGSAGLAARGSVRGSGRLTPLRDRDGFSASGTLQLRELVVNDARLGEVDLAHALNVTDALAGTAELRMRSPQFGPGHATAGFQGSGRALRVERLDARLLGLQARGQVALSQASPTASPIERADLQLQIDDLRPLGQLLGQPLRGTGAGQLRVDGQSGELTLALRELSAGADEALRLGRLELSGKARALHATPDIDLSLVASQLRAPMPAPAATPAATRVVSAAAAVTRDPDTLFIEQLSLTARGPMSRLSLRTDAQGWHGERVVSLDARATGRLWRTTRQLRIERLEARYGSEQARLQQPLELAREGALTRIQSLDLLIGQEGSEPGRVQGSMSLAPGRLQTDLQLERLPLDLAGRLEFAPIVAGELNGTLRLNADARAGARAETVNSGKARLVVDGLQIAGGPTRPVERIDATANAEWDGRELTLDGRVTRPLRTPLVVEARLPLRPDRDSLLSIPGDAQLQGNASWRGDLAELMVLTPPSDHVLAGQGVLDVRASGPVARPNLAGTLSIRDGHYENLLAGTLLEQLRLDTSFSQAGQARFDLSANDGANGTVTARGELRLSGESSRLDVQLATREALLVRLDEATVQSSSDLELSGALNDLRLGGQIQLDRGEIRLANPLPPSIVELEGVRIKGQPAPEADNAGGGAGLVRLDLKVLIPDQVFVRGRGLDSEWGGELDIGGYSDAPVVTGQIRARRGSLDFLGRNFKLQRGLVNFAGGRRIDPSLDINLERETSDLTGRILVTGTASNPQLSFESSPALPEDEVLPVILFGRSRQSLSALEAVQLAAGIATLTSGEASVVDRARAALGLDVLRVESSDKEDEASTVSVGRYVEDGVYVGARQSVDGKRSSVVVEVEVLDNVSIDADVGQGADTSVGVNWRKDF